jgi:AcrR family transcriptional regulator
MDGIDQFDRDAAAALMRVAAREGWGGVTMAAVAAEAGCGLAPLRARYACREALLGRFGTLIDAAAVTDPVIGDTPRERLFDVLMRRFDALQPHRAGVLAVARAAPSDPCLLALGVSAGVRSMGWMLEAAAIPASGLAGRLRAKALLAVWLGAFRAWAKDDSADLSATMAALDRLLDRAESLARTLEPLLPGRAVPDAASAAPQQEPEASSEAASPP